MCHASNVEKGGGRKRERERGGGVKRGRERERDEFFSRFTINIIVTLSFNFP